MAVERVLVVGVNRFDGVVENKPIHSAKILYLVKRKGKGVDKIGMEQASMNIPYDEFGDWAAPAYYELEFELAGNSIELVGKTLIGCVDLSNIPLMSPQKESAFEVPKAKKETTTK